MKFTARVAHLSLLLSSTVALLWLAGCGSYGGNGGGGGGVAPAVPAGLAAAGGNAQVTLTWTASSGATGYYVKRSITSGAEAQISAQSGTTFTDTGLTNGTKYFYVVSAYNSYGQSANSTEVGATPALPAPPAAPTGLVATPGNTQVGLTWSASTGATSYNVKRSTTNGSGYLQVPGPAPTTTAFTDTGLTNGTTYYYVVSAVNAGGESGNSVQASATPLPVPLAPTGLVATAGSAQVSLTWTASAGATSYHLKRGTTTGGPYGAPVTSAVTNFTDTTVTNGTKYFYVVTALNAIGESPNSNEANATPTSSTAIAVTVDVLSNRHAINPNVYGGSYPKDAATITDSGMSVVRWGGNATSTYNWQLFTYNADNDYFWEDFTSSALNNSADADSTQFIKDVIAAKGSPLTTMAMLPWVAKSAENGSNKHWSFSVAKYGAQCSVDPFNTDAGNGQKTDCSTPVATADPNDAYFPLLDSPGGSDPAGSVYRNAWAAALATAFGSAPHFYDMDNEIDIWAGTHRDIHPLNTTYNELRDVYLTESRALRGWDPAAIRFGPVSCCWYFYWRSATGGGDTSSHGGVDFLPWWLNEVAWSDAVAGNRSLDVFDIHAYPDGPNTAGFSLAQKQATALRVYRDWWDPNYASEASYIIGGGFSIQPVDSKPFRIPRMRAILNSTYPGTQFSITEWSAEIAGGADFSTALGDAEAYGILGRERVDVASRWTAPDPANPNYQTLKLYRNYDGGHHTFGQTSISATHNADPNFFSVFAALSQTGAPLTIMVVNKDPANAAQVTFTLNGFTTGTFKSYTLSQASPTSIVASSSQAWSNTQTFPPYSATLLVVTGAPAATPVAEWDLNPDTIQVPANGSVTLAPHIGTATGTPTVNISSAQFDNGGGTLTINTALVTTLPFGDGKITVNAGATPGFYHFTVTGQDSGGVTQKQGGWIVVANPAATLAKTGDNQSGTHGTTLNLSVTLSPGSSGGTAAGASILFTTDAGSFSGASKTIVTTDSLGKATVILTLPATAGTVHVTAEGPFGLGHPVVTFTEAAN